MLALSDVRDMTATLGISEDSNTYMGKLDSKKEKSIGVYHSKREKKLTIPLGGLNNSGYGVKLVSFLVHWNKSPRDTESVSNSLTETLNEIADKEVNKSKILFILATEPIDVSTDDDGIYEMVVEADIYYER